MAQKQELPPKGSVLFAVKGKPVTTQEFEYIYRKNNQGKSDEFTEEKIRSYLDLFINFKLKVYEATQRGIDTTQSFRKEFRSYRDELKKPYVAAADELDRLVKEAYQRLTEEVRASHLLINVSPDASAEDTLSAYNRVMEFRARVLGGESFEALARQFSEDPSARQNGGDLGYFTALQMVYPFEDAAFKLKPGDISMPVRTRFGYHLIYLIDRRPASGEVEVAHILLRGTDDKVRNKAFEVYDQWKGGRPWDELCTEFSDDAATKSNGGKLRPFGVGALATVPEFEKVAFSLQQPGDVSDPFRSNLGWHIVKLERKIPVPSFAELEPSLKRRIGRDERLQISKSAQLNKRKKEFGYTENQATKEQLLARADSTLQKGDWSALRDASLKSQVLFSLLGEPTTNGEFFKFVESLQRPSALPPPTYLQQLMDQFVEEKISEREDDKLQQENADYRNLLTEYREGILLFSIMEQEVWNKASDDTLGQRRYYEQNQQKYRAGERVNGRLLGAAEKGIRDDLKAKITRGDTLTEADLRKLRVVQRPRPYERGENKAIDQVPMAVGLHETEVDGMYYLVEIDRLVPAGTKTFAEARPRVISDYQDELEQRWLRELRGRYPVKVNKKAVKLVIANLQKK